LLSARSASQQERMKENENLRCLKLNQEKIFKVFMMAEKNATGKEERRKSVIMTFLWSSQ
jgi:hypothetical protein